MKKDDHSVNWSKSMSSHFKQCKQAPLTQSQLHNKAKQLALKYYGTEDLKALQKYQLDKVISWVTGIKPDQGKNTQKKAQHAQAKAQHQRKTRYKNKQHR